MLVELRLDDEAGYSQSCPGLVHTVTTHPIAQMAQMDRRHQHHGC